MQLKNIAFTSLLASTVLAWEDGVDCTGDGVSNELTGVFYVVDSDGHDVGCDELNDLGTIISEGK